jgi:Hint domain
MSTNTITGSIASYTIAADDVTLTNLGTIGTAAAVALGVTGNGDSVVNSGTVHGATFGISASLGVSVTNSGAGATIFGGTDGFYGAGSATYITNSGSIGGGTYGIELKAGGTVSNQSGGTITGGTDGIYLKAPGTVVNYGSIASNQDVRLLNGGTLINQSSGIMTGEAVIGAYGGATVVNYGSVLASTTTDFRQGVDIGQNSLLTNKAGGTIAGYFAVSVYRTGTVVNYGTLTGGHFGVQLFNGGDLTNQSGGTISASFGEAVQATGPTTVNNAGSISGGVYVKQGYLTNQATGVINAVSLTDDASAANGGVINLAELSVDATLVNAGHIGGSGDGAEVNSGSVLTNQSNGTITGSLGVYLTGSSTLVNDGKITSSGTGVREYGFGVVTNNADGTITAGTSTGSVGVAIDAVPNFVYYNYKFYNEGYQSGLGSVTNAGLISGAYGVRVRNLAATVVDSGTIVGSTAAIAFAAGFGGRLVLDPGASITGAVLGAGAVLELASSAAVGMLNSLGSQFTGFAQVTVDAGAYWQLNSSDTFTAGTELTNDGTLKGSGSDAARFAPGAGNRVVLGQGGSFIGVVDGGNTLGSSFASTLELTADTAVRTLTGLGSQYINFSQFEVDAGGYWVFNPDTFASGVTLTNSGTVGGSVVFGAGADNRVVDYAGAVFLGGVDGGNTIGSTAVSTLELTGGGSTGTLSGLGTEVINFAQIVVDSGASWYLTSDSLAAGTTLTNAGTLAGPGGTAAVFSPGADNRLVIDQGGTFTGTVDGGNTIGASFVSVLELAAGPGAANLTGIGTQFVNFAQVIVDASANWSLYGSNAIVPGAVLSVSGELVNSGSLNGDVTLAGGTMLNDVGATIAGAVTGTGTVNNAGIISGSGGTAVSLAAGYPDRVMVAPGAVFGGVVIANDPSSVLELSSGASVGTLGGIGTQYLGFTQIAVDTGSTWNFGGNTIAAGTTLTDTGSITGSPDALEFAAGAGNRLILEAGASFSGIVNGGNTLGSADGSTLELAKSYHFGTVSGVGTQIINFASVIVDSQANWGLYGNNSIAPAATLTVFGDLSNYSSLTGNVTLAAGGELQNSSLHLIKGSVIGIASGVSLKNLGSIKTSGSVGVSFSAGGTVDNNVIPAYISGASYGILMSGSAATVGNVGQIAGGTAGVALLAGGQVDNGYASYPTGRITGASAVILGSGGGTVANYSQLTGNSSTGNGVLLQAGGYIHNGTNGTIKGFVGILQQGAGAATVWNSSTIHGTSDAILLHAGAANRVIDNPGAIFQGVVDGGNTIGATAVSTLELASSATHGIIGGLGTNYIDFAQITADANSYWKLTSANTIVSGQTLTELSGAYLLDAGTLVNNGAIVLDPSDINVADLTGSGSVTINADSELEVQNTIATGENVVFGGNGAYLYLANPASATGSVTNFDVGEAIGLKGIDPATVSYSSGTLHFGSGQSFSLTLANPTDIVQATASSDGAVVSAVLCFCANTMILTPSGERRVQDLTVGDLVATHRGEARRIEWIGTGKVLATRGRRNAATPVIVRKGALDDNVPNRDLRVTKGHCLFIDGVLIPVEELINHRSIEWDDRAQEVELYHIELATHDVLIANGAPAESYRDDGNRWLFDNANCGWDLPSQEPCAALLTSGPVVDAVWRRLLDRAGARPGLPLTDDADLHLLVDGQRLDAVTAVGGACVFQLPERPVSVRIMSHAAVPSELGLARDPRLLGVALRSVALRYGTKIRVLMAADVSLTDGFHAFEPDNGFRWTDGEAAIPPGMFNDFAGALELVLQVAATTRYQVECDRFQAA